MTMARDWIICVLLFYTATLYGSADANKNATHNARPGDGYPSLIGSPEDSVTRRQQIGRDSMDDTSKVEEDPDCALLSVITAYRHQVCIQVEPPTDNKKTLIDELFDKYDARIPPNYEQGKATEVDVQVLILSLDTISETNMDFAMSMFLRQSWYEPRFNFTPLADKYESAMLKTKNMRMLELDTNLMSKVWVPDTYMPAEKKASVHVVTVPNKLMHIYPDGRIQYSQRISATLKCNFDLRKYPLDEQQCLVEFESYGYTTETLKFRWHKDALLQVKTLKVPQFTLREKIDTGTCEKNFVGVSYTCVSFTFHLKRTMGYYITQVYIPSYLIVFLSWVSFWLDIDAVPARISLGLLTVLTMTTQSAGARANLPKVSYVKAIDVWMATCLAFVFLALVQFAYVNVLSRVEKRRKTKNVVKVGAGAFMQGAGLGMNLKQNANKPNNSTSSPEKPPLPATEGRKPSFLMAARKVSKDAGNGVQPPVVETSSPVKPSSPTSTTDVEKQCPEKTESQGQKSGLLESIRNLKLDKLLSTDREKARNVDRAARYLFPLAFLIFNIIYWCVYVFWIPEPDV